MEHVLQINQFTPNFKNKMKTRTFGESQGTKNLLAIKKQGVEGMKKL